MSRIELNVVATGNFRGLETSVARLRSQVDSLNASMLGIGFNSTLGKSLSSFQNQFNATIDQSGMFERHMVNLTTETTRFGRSLESGSLRLGQLFRTATEYRRGELGQIRQLAREQVRMMNATTMRMADGSTQVIVPRGIDEGIERQKILNQEYRIFRQVVQNGSTEIINWGKNTQWAGRQLTVGLTVPLTIFGAAAGKMFMDADKQLTRLTKVYGDATKGMVDQAELSRIRSETLALSQDIARGMGVAVEETLSIAADIAATGKEGNELLASTREAMRLSVLGEVDRQEAMRATLSIQSVFKKDTEGLTQSINLLNAVENQTSATIDDLVTGIVKAGPVVQGLGGDVEDLAAMMVAMREGGINASEAANAIKSSLASLINPTKQTTQVLGDFGIDIKGIVDQNAGDVIGTLIDLQTELSNLDDLSRQRSIEQIFGKFQFSRINALLANLGKSGSQTEQVFAIANMSVQELAANAERELTAVTESASGKFQRAVESIKANIIPIGEVFITAGTIILNIGNKILEVFNSLPDPVKNIVNGILGLTAVAGPIIMITGVLGNFFGYLVKGLSTIMAFKKEGRGAFELLTVDSIAARDANELLSESLYDQASAMSAMANAVETLVDKLQELANNIKNVKNAGAGMAESMANAEAATFSRSATPYTTPAVNLSRRASEVSGWEDAGVEYSHLTAESHLLGTPGLGARRQATLGLGTFVQGEVATLQSRLKDMIVDLLAIPTEAMATPEQRRAELLRIARRHHAGNQMEFEKTAQIIQGLTDEQLAQVLPSWEKISLQTSQYSGIMSASAKAIEQGNLEAKTAMETFKTESISIGRERALENLRGALRAAGVNVEQEIQEIAGVFERIALDASQVSPGAERAEFLLGQLANPQTGVVRYETNAQDIFEGTDLAGFDKKSGFNRVLMLAIQSVTDAYFNEAAVSEELALAAQAVADARRGVASASEEQKRAAKEETAATERLAAAKDDAQKRLQAAYKTGPRDLSDITRRVVVAEDGTENVEWLRGDKQIPASQTKLIEALNKWYEESVNAATATANVSEKARLVVQGQTDLDLANQNLAELKRLEAQDLMASMAISDELYAATIALAESRRMAAEIRLDEEKLEAANAELALARSNAAKADQKRLQAQLTYGFDSEEAKSATQVAEEAKKFLAEKEIEAAGLEEQLNELRKRKIENIKKQELEEKRVIELRKREGAATQENIIATEIDTEQTKKSAASEGQQAGAVIENTKAVEQDTLQTRGGDSGGIFRGGKLGGAISMLSMAAMFLPRPSEDTGLGQAMGSGMNILNMAGMGSIFGGPGIAIGAAAGVAIEGISFLGRKAEENAQELDKIKAASRALTTGLTDVEKQFFDVKPLKELTDLPLGAFNLKTQEATDKLQEFARALKEAEPGSTEAGRVTAVSEMSDASQFISSPMFTKMVSEALLSGMSIEDIKIMVGGYLEAAGKTAFAPLVNAELVRIGKLGNKPEDIGAKYLAELQDIADRVIGGAGYNRKQAEGLREAQQEYETARGGSQVQAIDPNTGELRDANAADMAKYLQMMAERYDVSTKDLIAFITEGTMVADARVQRNIEQAASIIQQEVLIDGEEAVKNPEKFYDILKPIEEIIAISPDLSNLENVMGAVGNETELMLNAILSTLSYGGKTFDSFLGSLGASANALNNNAQLWDQLSAKFGEMSPDAQKAFDIMRQSGVQLQDALRITSMVISDVNTDWAALADMARRNPAEFRATVWTSYVQGSAIGSTPTAQGAASPEDALQAALGAIDYSGGGAGGSGGSGGSDYYDKLIEAQDKIIEGIQKEREERQKILDLQEKQMDFALRRQDLENQIARAIAEGNFAEAALLQAELDAEKKKYEQQEIERRRQEREDKKIQDAEKEKERIQNLKDGSSGGGGGGASGEVSEAQKQWTANRIEILTSGVVNWTEGAQLRTSTLKNGPWSAFFNSDQVKEYRKELDLLGVPAENIDQILNQLYDSWIENNELLFGQTEEYKFIEDALKGVGVEADDLKNILPDTFGILLDKNLTKTEQIDLIADALYDLGYNSEEAARKAKKLYDQYNNNKFESKGIDEELQKWIEWNDIVQKAAARLRRIQKLAAEDTVETSLLQTLGVSEISGADRLEETAITAAGQSTANMGPTFNAGGVILTGKQIGTDLMAGVNEGITSGAQAAEAATRKAIQIYETWMRDETKTQSPSKVYELLGKDMMAGLVNGLVLPEDSALKITTSLQSTFEAAVDSYKTMFTDPSLGIDGILSQEVTTASENFYTIMTTGMQNTVDEINRILTGGIKDYTFQITGDPKIYDGGARSIWQRVFSNIPDSTFTSTPPAYATGGYVDGPGGPTDDKILARLSNGEYVVKASSVKQYGTGLLDDINNRKFAYGGYVSADRAETSANNNVYAGGWKPKPSYSGGTPTYSGGYNSSNTQGTGASIYKPKNMMKEYLKRARSISNYIRPEFQEYPGLMDTALGLWQQVRNIGASVTDLLVGGFVPPWMRDNQGEGLWARTALGSAIGGQGYMDATGRELIAAMLDFAPGGGGPKKAGITPGVGKLSPKAATGTRASRNIVAKDYSDMMGISRADFEAYVETAWPNMSTADRSSFISTYFDESGKLKTLDLLDIDGFAGTKGEPGLRLQQQGNNPLDVIRDISQAKRFRGVYDELVASGDSSISNMSYEDFLGIIRESSVSAQDTGRWADAAARNLDADFIKKVNSVYAKQNYGLSDSDYIRLYRGLTNSEASNVHGVFRGYSTTDPNVAKSFARWADGQIWATDISVADLPQIFGTTGWADEFAQFIPESAWAEIITDHGISSKFDGTRSYRSYDPENTLMSRRVPHEEFVKSQSQIEQYARSIGLDPVRLLSNSGFRRVGPYWQLDLGKAGSVSSKNKQLIKYMQDELGIDLVSLKTGDGLSPFKFAKGGLVKVGADNLTVLGEGISNYAKRYVGTPYSSGAAWADGPANGWGCATATKWLYDSYAGVDVGHPSLSASQYSSGAGSRVNSKMPGDLLFFYYPNGVNTENPINHVGMYTGAGSMFHARSPQLGTQITGVDDAGMARAQQRAGGSAIKRYMPMTIAGMGLPTAALANGGKVYGKGGPTTDEILAWISNGEYVMNAGAVKHYGKDFMDAVNKGVLPEAAMGGMLSSKYPGVVQRMASGGMLMSKYGKGGMISSSPNIEYNINVNVSGTNSSADEIASTVMQSIERKERMNRAVTKI